MDYKWNTSEIEERIRYVKERLNRTHDQKEIEKLNVTLLTYLSMLDNSGTLRYTRYTNIMDKITNDSYVIKRNNETKRMENSIIASNIGEFDENYINFLLELCKNAVNNRNSYDEYILFTPQEYSNIELVNISKKFYDNLDDSEITEKANIVFNKPQNINFTTLFRTSSKDYNGINYNDYIFKESFITIKKEDTIMDILTTNHEIGHAINFAFNYDKLFENTYGGFAEVPTYTIDYLMLDFMEELGFNQEEINKLRERKENSLYNLAKYTLNMIKGRMLRSNGMEKYNNFTSEDVKNNLRLIERKNLLEIESIYIAKELYNQIKENKEEGLNKLKEFMKKPTNRSDKPDFSSIGITDEMILECSKKNNIKKKEK